MPTPTSPTNEDKDFLKKKGGLFIQKEDLLPPAQKHYDTLKKTLPIALLVNQERPAQILALPSGQQVLVVGENDHQWTKPYVEKHPEVLGNSESTLNSMPRLTNPDILKSIQAFAKTSGVKQTPIAVVENDAGTPPALGSAGAVRSSGGKDYILVGSSIANDLKRAIPQIAHEFGHIVYGDGSVEAQIAKHNDTTKGIARGHEIRADEYSVKLCQGDASANNMEEAVRFFEAQGMQVPPSPEGHPSPSERIPLLRAGAKAERAAGRCK